MGDLTQNFSLKEFRSKDGAITPLGVISNLRDLAFNLEMLREKLGKPIYVSSGYRSEEYNKAVGGAERSQHLHGRAADIRCDGLTPAFIKSVIEIMISDGLMIEGGIGLYQTFVHYDIRGTKARWII